MRLTLLTQPARITQTLIRKIILGKDGTWIQLRTEDIENTLVPTPPSLLPALPETEVPDIVITSKADHLEIRLLQSYAEKKKYKITQTSKHNTTLLTAIGNGYRWERMLQENPELDQKQLAKQEGVDYHPRPASNDARTGYHHL